MGKTILEQVAELQPGTKEYQEHCEKLAKVWLILAKDQAEREAKAREVQSENKETE